ncbi:MAG: metal-binding protein [Pyrinomonadaceae bacterium]
MPSGRTHDAVTILLAVPTFVAGYVYAQNPVSGGVIGAVFLFGGLMFGPDLDTVSRQYSRWSVFRFLWTPYRWCFKHRSRFSHGLIFGALLRVVYFLGILTLAAFLGALVWTSIYGGKAPTFAELAHVWQGIGEFTRANLGDNFFLFAFLGLWLGAASHTFTDVIGSYIKTGRIAKFL